MPEDQGTAISADGSVRYALRVPVELTIFRSHFPAMPIVPGVELVRWAVVFGRRQFKMPERFAGVEKLRFRRPVSPGLQLSLELRYLSSLATLHFSFRSTDEPKSRVMADGRILFTDATGA